MELVITKKATISSRECTNYVVPDELWVKFKFECCYPDGKCTIGKAGETKAQLSMQNDTVTLKESGEYEVCLLGRNTKSSLYAELIQAGGGGGQTVVVAAGENVTVDKSQSGDTVTYTVNAKDDDSKTVLQAGENISITSSKSGDTTTWTISGEAGGSNTVVEAGDNVTVTSRESGGVTTYTVNANEQESHTEVRAGENVSVTTSTEGDKTIYTVSSTGGGDGKTYEVVSTTPDTLTVNKVSSGNTVTFNLAATGGTADVELESTDPNLIITKE